MTQFFPAAWCQRWRAGFAAPAYTFVAGDGKPLSCICRIRRNSGLRLTAVAERVDLQTDPPFPRTATRAFRVRFHQPGAGRKIHNRAARSLADAAGTRRARAPLNNFAEVFEDPQVQYLDRVHEFSEAGLGSFKLVKTGINLSDTPPAISRRPPKLGEQNDETLRALGYSAEEIDRFHAKKIV
jgi:crotonobetainyl-CoA:carnitine CoA-transferase CaiB-like acyl-CoA transferase